METETYLTTANILCLLCGSLIATVGGLVVITRQKRMDERFVRRIKTASYQRGWQDGKDAGISLAADNLHPSK